MEYLLFISLFAIILAFGVLNYRYERKKGKELEEMIKRIL